MKKVERQVEVLLESLIEVANIQKVIESLPKLSGMAQRYSAKKGLTTQ